TPPSVTSKMSRMYRTRETAGLVSFLGLLAFPRLRAITQAGFDIHLRGDRTWLLRGAIIEVSMDREDHDRIINVRCTVEVPVWILRVDLLRSARQMIGTVLRERMPIIREFVAGGCVAKANRGMVVADVS